MVLQSGLFDEDLPEISVTKKVRMITLFSGYDSQCMAMKRIGADFEIHKTCEWQTVSTNLMKSVFHSDDNTDYSINLSDTEVINELIKMGVSINDETPATEKELQRKGSAWCRKTYNNYKSCKNIGSITNIHGEDLEITDKDKYFYMMFYSFCCLTNDSLILTKKGYIPLENVQVGDEVLTKSNTWHKVAKKFVNGFCPTYYVDAMGFENIHCTPNHKFWIREMYRKYPTLPNGKRKNIRLFKEPEFKEIKDITKRDYFGIPVIQEEKSFYTDDLDFWFMLGMYLGDGCLETSGNGISISCNAKKLKLLTEKLSFDKWKYTFGNSSSCYYFRFSNKAVKEFIKEYIGEYCDKKQIPYEILCLPKAQLQAFYNGYLNSDGCIINGKHQFTSINRNLIYSISAIINKLYQRPTCIYKVHTSRTKVIEGRIVNQKDWYQLRFNPESKKQDKAFYEDGYIWFPFNKITKGDIEPVFNMEVEEDHSYIVQGCISKNCQDLSIAGKQKGMSRDSNTRSGLLWQVERLLFELREKGIKEKGNPKAFLPDCLCLENVVQLHSAKNMPDFQQWINSLNGLGYTSYWQDCNAKFYGIPQNRDRTFMISLLGNYDYSFPETMPLEYCMADVLEDEVDEKYFINNERAENLIQQLIVEKKIPEIENE